MEKLTIISQIECTEGGAVQVRLAKQIVEGNAVLSQGYHRAIILPGEDIDAKLALINDSLAELTYPAMSPEDMDRIRGIAAIQHTPEVVAAWMSRAA